MRRNTSLLVVFLAFAVLSLLVLPALQAQDTVVPAGTLFRCTMSEPNFSSATAQVGDPVLCHLAAVQIFGRNIFPRGAYMAGHLEADKEPGHFFGKGYLKIIFERIALPNTELPLDAKIVAARGYHVDKEGDIRGKGHAKRDVVEWLIPPLWPWKVITLPARGPRPTLKGEQVLTLRLMEDVSVPKLGATYNSRDWRPPQAQNFTQPSALPSREIAPPTSAAVNANYVVSVDPAFTNARHTVETTALPESRAVTKSLTLLALRNETIYAVTDYWLDGDRLDYLLPSGNRGACALTELDLVRTTQLNSERGVSVTFSDVPPSRPAL
jgi:hypothetical protein